MYSDMTFENLEHDHVPENPIPGAIIDYYMNHGYADRMIPLNADTCRGIAKILDGIAD